MTRFSLQHRWRSHLVPVSAMISASLLFATPGLAQTRTGNATLTIERALTVNAMRAMKFSGSETALGAQGAQDVTEAVIEVTGDPGRVYRITLPLSVEADGGTAIVDALTLRSENSGDITRTLTARMSAQGSDRLYIGGRLRSFQGLFVTGVISVVPMGIDYE